ncbi:MG2 domain-containing protein [Geitlerinema splendidum]|nr:MG2 domain-containing protein [Geitlerinema splendidum]
MKLSELLKPGGIISLIFAVVAAVAITATGVTAEVPIGQLSGTAVMKGINRGLPNAEVIAFRSENGTVVYQQDFYTRTNEEGEFEFKSLPAGSYVLAIIGKRHSIHNFAVEVKEAERTKVNVLTEAMPSYVSVNAGSRVFLPGEPIKVRIEGASDYSTVTYSVHQASHEAIEASRNPENLFYAIASDRNRQSPELMAKLKEVSKESIRLTQVDIEGVFVEEHQLETLGEGVYLLKAQVDQQIDYTWLTVTKIALITKSASGNGHAFVCDIQTGEPIAGASVKVTSQSKVQDLAPTNSEGISTFSGITQASGQVLVAASYGGSSAYTWFYDRSDDPSESAVASFTLDRPVYRPGDKVFFKATLRDRVQQGHRLPTGETRLAIEDPDGEVIKEWSAALDSWGAVSGEIQLPAEGLVGEYALTLSYGESKHLKWIPVLEYRKPHFKIDVTTEKPRYVRGDQIEFVVTCTTFTGEPVIGSKVLADLKTSIAWLGSPFDDEYDDYYDYGFSGDYVESFEAVTDNNGQAKIIVHTNRVLKSAEYADFGDSKFTLEASVEEEGGRYYLGEGSATVLRGTVGLEADFSHYVSEPGQSAELEIRTFDNLNAQAKPAEVELEWGRERWTRSGYAFISEVKTKVKTGSDGITRLELRPQTSGSYVAKLRLKDSRGNTVSSEAYLYSYSSAGADDSSPPSLRIILDKPNYQPGEDASVLIQTDKPGGYALVTVEADSLLLTRVVELGAQDTMIHLKVLSDYAPNVQVAVSLVKDKRYASSSKKLRVSTVEKELELSITPDRAEARPGETVNLLVEAKDASGQPVQADVAVGVVDEGVYQILEDRANPLKDFYFERWSNVATAYSFPEIYLDGEDKASPNDDVRMDFKDTALWAPGVKTDTLGRAILSVTLPDNLTSWRATGTAITRDTRIGKSKSNFVAKKELMNRLSLPQFFTQDDTQAVTGTVTNATDDALKVKVAFSCVGAQVIGDLVRNVTIPARSSQSITWNVKAGLPGKAIFRLKAESDVYSDSLEQSVDVAPRASWRNIFANGSFVPPTDAQLAIDISEDAVAGEVRLLLEPSLLHSLMSSLDYLVDYPYGCAEQTMSRFVPAVQVRALLEKTGYQRPDLEAKIDEVIRRSEARLRDLQQAEGGFGWFEYDDPDPRMTAVVLDGWRQARASGVSDRKKFISSTLSAAKKMLAGTPGDAYGMSELASAVLLLESHPSAITIIKNEASKPNLSIEKLSRIAVTLTAEIKRKPNSADLVALRDKVYRQVKSKTLENNQLTTFTDVFDATAAMSAMLTVEPDSPHIESILRSLLGQRNGNRWGDTWRTSSVVSAAAEYIKLKPINTAKGQAVIYVNGQQVASQPLGVGVQAVDLKLPVSTFRAGSNQITVRFQGEGRVYYSLETKQGIYEQKTAPKSTITGLSLKREYVRMEPTRLQDGSIRLIPSNRATTSFKSGEVYRCRLTIKTDRAVSYLMIEDPIPSNSRIVDADRAEPGWDWQNWWSNSTFYDDKATFFVWSLQPGEHTIEYAVRAESIGECVALPTRASPMYLQNAYAHTGQTTLEVKR